ncbi:hypothetical protein [Ensifer sp. MJa1]|uniref:hypothetical protein n=1 Tax=Ensifer sp. MJa1 TaxID=2919888 RepID=UPI00300B4F8E
MSRRPRTGLIIPVALVVVAGVAIAAQDKFTVQVAGGLSLSECRGYDDWPAACRRSLRSSST